MNIRAVHCYDVRLYDDNSGSSLLHNAEASAEESEWRQVTCNGIDFENADES